MQFALPGFSCRRGSCDENYSAFLTFMPSQCETLSGWINESAFCLELQNVIFYLYNSNLFISVVRLFTRHYQLINSYLPYCSNNANSTMTTLKQSEGCAFVGGLRQCEWKVRRDAISQDRNDFLQKLSLNWLFTCSLTEWCWRQSIYFLSLDGGCRCHSPEIIL